MIRALIWTTAIVFGVAWGFAYESVMPPCDQQPSGLTVELKGACP